MKENSPILHKLANLVSILGHPLLTWSVFLMYVSFRQLPIKNAILVSGLVFGGIVLPICVGNYRKVKRGIYTNFDVSNRQQRADFYPVVIGLVALATGILFVTNQPRSFGYGMSFVLLLLVVSYGINFSVKASLHTSLSFFLAWTTALISLPLGIVFGFLALVVAVSRLILKRHTFIEVAVGLLIGLTIGAGFFLFIRSSP